MSCRRAVPHKLFFRHRRASGEFLDEGIADVAQIFNPDFAGKKAIRGELAQEAEELNALAQTRITLEVLPIRDQVENFLLLRHRAIEVRLFVAVDAGIIKPHETATERELIIVIFAGQQIDELGSAS